MLACFKVRSGNRKGSGKFPSRAILAVKSPGLKDLKLLPNDITSEKSLSSFRTYHGVPKISAVPVLVCYKPIFL